MKSPLVARSSVLSALLLLTLLMPSFTRAAATHDTAWCQKRFICTNPTLYYVLYSQINTDYACACSAGTSGCFGAGGYIYCAYATLAMQNCVSWPVGETAAANAGTEYGYCSACANGYQLSLAPRPSPACWACSAVISNCAMCSGNGVCSGCTNGYQLFPKQNVCGKCASNCQSCSSPNTCDVCNTGYTASADKTTCFACSIPGCNGCTANGICGACASQYTLSPDKKRCYQCNLDGCASCSADSVCSQCNSDLTLSSDGKKCFSCGIKGCTGCTADGACSACAAEHTMSSDRKACFACAVANCNSCTSDKVCGSCAAGYTLQEDGACAKHGIPWWVWLIIGLVLLVIASVVIILICCFCCRPRADPLYAEENQPAVNHMQKSSFRRGGWEQLFDGAADEKECAMQTQPSDLSQRRRRVVSIGGSVILADAPINASEVPAPQRSQRGSLVFSTGAPCLQRNLDETQSLTSQYRQPVDNPLDSLPNRVSMRGSPSDNHRGRRRGLTVDLTDEAEQSARPGT